MNVLVACEESQRVCKAFREKGHNAFSCDIIECSGGHPEWHIKGDALEILNPKKQSIPGDTWFGLKFRTMDGTLHIIDGKWDLIIAHPPCTYLSNAGARWLYAGGTLNVERYKKGIEAKNFFLQFYNADCEKIAIENPVASSVYDLPKYTQIIEPYYFGHKATKKTCLWLKNLPELKETNNVGRPEKIYFRQKNGNIRTTCWAMQQKGDKAKERSKTFEGIAKAMADQWG